MTFYPRDMGHVWSGGGALSQWARLDLTVNKTTTLFWRGLALVWLTVDTTCVNEPHAVKWRSVVFLCSLEICLVNKTTIKNYR